MAVNLHDILSRLRNKTAVIVERCNALEAEKQRVEEINANLQQEVGKLNKMLAQANSEIEYLRIVHSISIRPENLMKSKAILTKLVQDIDKCISQLNE